MASCGLSGFRIGKLAGAKTCEAFGLGNPKPHAGLPVFGVGKTPQPIVRELVLFAPAVWREVVEKEEHLGLKGDAVAMRDMFQIDRCRVDVPSRLNLSVKATFCLAYTVLDDAARHRAALGLAEQTDAVVLVVSEETGAFSLAYDSRLFYALSTEEVRRRLKHLLNLREEGGDEGVSP